MNSNEKPVESGKFKEAFESVMKLSDLEFKFLLSEMLDITKKKYPSYYDCVYIFLKRDFTCHCCDEKY